MLAPPHWPYRMPLRLRCTLVVAQTAVAAAFLPARQATRVDPARALRAQ